jgi:hypothetical protein
MNYMQKLKQAGVVANLVETAEFAGASFGFGYLQNKYRKQAHMFGVPADLLAGVVLKAASLGCDVFNVAGAAAPHLNIIGNAGVGAFFHTLGAGYGSKSAGVKRLLIPEGDEAKMQKAFPNAEVLGAIGKAPKGDFLSSADLAALAR